MHSLPHTTRVAVCHISSVNQTLLAVNDLNSIKCVQYAVSVVFCTKITMNRYEKLS